MLCTLLWEHTTLVRCKLLLDAPIKCELLKSSLVPFISAYLIWLQLVMLHIINGKAYVLCKTVTSISCIPPKNKETFLFWQHTICGHVHRLYQFALCLGTNPWSNTDRILSLRWSKIWVSSIILHQLYPKERATGTHWTVDWVSPRIILDVKRKKIIPYRDTYFW